MKFRSVQGIVFDSDANAKKRFYNISEAYEALSGKENEFPWGGGHALTFTASGYESESSAIFSGLLMLSVQEMEGKQHLIYKQLDDNLVMKLGLTLLEDLFGSSKLAPGDITVVQSGQGGCFLDEEIPISKKPGQKCNLIVKFTIIPRSVQKASREY
ncbi:hypothetical protein BX616_009879 [Lobosporangium transversale]|nr:hypothetical protein BX616_009879 [Lobosporangium transversale]